MKRMLAVLLAALLLLSGTPALGGEYRASDANVQNLVKLLKDLVYAYERPLPEDGQTIDRDLEAIRGVNEADYEIAEAIAAHWRAVYLDGSYRLHVFRGDKRAAELLETGIPDSVTHAFVVLGYQLKDGKMRKELMGRCEAAAAAARAFPGTILVCSGGATGENNPKQYTEAGLMKAYLVQKCGIDASRIHIDERAMTTVENAENTFAILEERGVRTMTIVTSTYHQRWGQAVYNAVGAIYRREHGYSVDIVGNYCFDIEPSSDSYRHDDRIAARQLGTVLKIPKEAMEG